MFTLVVRVEYAGLRLLEQLCGEEGMSHPDAGGDVRFRDRLRRGFLRPRRTSRPSSDSFHCSPYARDPLDDGTSFKNDTRHDSSMRSNIIFTAAPRTPGSGGVVWFGKDSSRSRMLLGMLISRAPSGMM